MLQVILFSVQNIFSDKTKSRHINLITLPKCNTNSSRVVLLAFLAATAAQEVTVSLSGFVQSSARPSVPHFLRMLLGCYKAAGRNDRLKASCPEGALGVEYIQCGSIGISGYLCL